MSLPSASAGSGVLEAAEGHRLEAAEGHRLEAAEGHRLEAAEGHRLEALFVMGMMLALRPGELTDLRWTDVDLEAGVPIRTRRR